MGRITPLRDLGALAGLLGVLRRVRPKIVHAHTPKEGLLGMIAATLRRVPVRLFHVRGFPLLCTTGLRRRLLWCADWLACRLAHQASCVSHSLREEVIRAELCPPAKIKVLGGGSGNGVDAGDRFNAHRLGDAARALNADARIGAPVIINSGAIIEHDCVVADGSHISPGAILAGGVEFGERSWIGAGATVIQGITIGADVMVGAGAVMIRDVPDGATVAGVPARRVRPRGDGWAATVQLRTPRAASGRATAFWAAGVASP